jgi:hypothetical protein
MKKTLVGAALAGMLVAVAVAACGGSSSNGGSGASSADRDKFVGTWTGNYSCDVTTTFPDKMIIKAGSGDLDLSINIHVDFANPDTVTGTLTSPTEVNVPEQSMGGGTGTAKLTLNGDKLDFRATGLGITCGGSDYTLVP